MQAADARGRVTGRRRGDGEAGDCYIIEADWGRERTELAKVRVHVGPSVIGLTKTVYDMDGVSSLKDIHDRLRDELEVHAMEQFLSLFKSAGVIEEFRKLPLSVQLIVSKEVLKLAKDLPGLDRSEQIERATKTFFRVLHGTFEAGKKDKK